MNAKATAAVLAALLSATATATAEVLTVTEGQSIQAAIKRAAAGDTVKVMPGVYKETLYIDKDNVHLTGVIEAGRWPTLEGDNTRNDGILVSGHNVIVENFYVRHYIGNGIMTQGANNFSVLHNRVEGPGFYGIFPQYGHNGLIAYNLVSGITGTGMYVGMSENVDIEHNESFNNHGFGIEVENCNKILIENNYSHGNTVGVVLNLIPGLPVKKELRSWCATTSSSTTTARANPPRKWIPRSRAAPARSPRGRACSSTRPTRAPSRAICSREIAEPPSWSSITTSGRFSR